MKPEKLGPGTPQGPKPNFRRTEKRDSDDQRRKSLDGAIKIALEQAQEGSSNVDPNQTNTTSSKKLNPGSK